jgi:hypothetical protein
MRDVLEHITLADLAQGRVAPHPAGDAGDA